MEGVVNVSPDPSDVPPVEVVYQFAEPTDTEAERSTVPVPQRFPGTDDVTIGTELTVAVTATRAPEEQVPELDST